MNGNGNTQIDSYAPGRVHWLFTALLIAAAVAGCITGCVLSLLASGAR